MQREGADITAEDMVGPLTEPSNIQQYFSSSTIFVTGATGFLGRLLVEKLLRTCFDLSKMYILVRPKGNKSVEQRLQEYFDDALYERLKREKSEAMAKLFVIEGDCYLPDLGLNEQDKQLIISEVNYIFHAAATLRFNEKLRVAAYTNARGTRDILKLAKKITNLRSFVYVSTAYSFCPRKIIDEEFYEPHITGDKLLTLVETLNDDVLEKIAPILIDEWPNTYTFTKSVAEDIIRKESNGLPIAVVRPSIVVVTSKEPVSGWINNSYGATGIFVNIGMGVVRTLYCDATYVSDLVPADYAINTMIAAAWNIAKTRGSNLNSEMPKQETDCNNIPVYNYVSSTQNPITWRECISKGNQHLSKAPSVLQIWHSVFKTTSSTYGYLFLHYTLHLLPAYIVDFLAFCIGKRPQMVKMYGKIEKLLDVLGYFMRREWVFRNNNTQELWKMLNDEDKKLFEFDMSLLDWDMFFYTYVRGVRVYLVKDPLNTIAEARAKRFKLMIAHYALVTIFMSIFVMFVWHVML
ncbi:hypothetical protein ILUMI_11094 [Ignelater luminosus]|uniref:Fatty acyl-CoA reductase n=1 Tax=Ignelater luminosus TaxID=2038154 RepID=A0A8K0D148_IGNLU|nr:hypothetical protein ILUMI_11094 [Ignelater luminosus]